MVLWNRTWCDSWGCPGARVGPCGSIPAHDILWFNDNVCPDRWSYIFLVAFARRSLVLGDFLSWRNSTAISASNRWVQCVCLETASSSLGLFFFFFFLQKHCLRRGAIRKLLKGCLVLVGLVLFPDWTSVRGISVVIPLYKPGYMMECCSSRKTSWGKLFLC